MKPVLGSLARQLLAGVAIWSAVSAFAGGDPPTAGELIAKVVAARQTIGYRVRARLVRTTTATWPSSAARCLRAVPVTRLTTESSSSFRSRSLPSSCSVTLRRSASSSAFASRWRFQAG